MFRRALATVLAYRSIMFASLKLYYTGTVILLAVPEVLSMN
jgi:hypothetical protein